jgi:hypothetical protein
MHVERKREMKRGQYEMPWAQTLLYKPVIFFYGLDRKRSLTKSK